MILWQIKEKTKIENIKTLESLSGLFTTWLTYHGEVGQYVSLLHLFLNKTFTKGLP